MPKPTKTKGEKPISKSVSKKKDKKPAKKEEEIEKNVPQVKSPPIKNRPKSVKKNVSSETEEKTPAAQPSHKKAPAKKKKLTSIGKKKVPKKFSESNESKPEESEEVNKAGKNSKKTKSIPKGKSRSRSRSKSKSKSETNDKPQTPTSSKKSTPSKGSGDTSSKQKASGGLPPEIHVRPQTRQVKGKRGVSPSPPGGKKIQASKVKESSSNIESSSSIDLSAEQKKKTASERVHSMKSSSREKIGPETQRIHAEVETVIKKIEDKKRIRKGDDKFLDKKRKRDKSTALVGNTAKDFDYILQKNPNVKSKPYINLEELSKHHVINYSEILLSLLEIGHNSESYLFPFSSKSKCFWADALEYTVLKKIFVDFKAETLRKYWSELSKYDTDDTADIIKKNKSYLDQAPLKLGTLVSSITKLLKGEIKDLKQYIDDIKIDIRKKELYEDEFENPITGEKTKIKNTKIIYRKKYEPGNVKDFKGTVLNILTLKEIYHQNPKESEFQKVMTTIKNEDTLKYTYLNEKIEEEKRRINTINEEDKFIFKAIDNVLDALSAEFKTYSPEFILEALKQNSMDIGKTYTYLKDPIKNRNIGFSALDDMVLKKKTGEEYKILLKEKGKEAIQEREEFLSH